MLEKRLTKFSWVTYLAILLVSVMSKIKKKFVPCNVGNWKVYNASSPFYNILCKR